MFAPHPIDVKLAAILPEGSLFSVGGRVRDELRAEIEGVKTEPKDLDYVVAGLPMDEIRERLRGVEGLQSLNLVGASFSVLKLVLDGHTVDIALPRREHSVGTGHRDFVVESGPDISLEDDLARRDFRMNMIARALPDGELVDPYDGEDDIRNRRISILTPDTFLEDPLRLLRAVQFAARFAYQPTEDTLNAMRAAAPLISTVSAERVCEELTKLFVAARKPSEGLELMRSTGLLQQIWPELLEGVGVEQNEWHAYDVWRHNLETSDAMPLNDITLRLSALLHDIGKPRTKDGPHFYRHEQVGADMARAMLERFRFPGNIIDRVEHLVRQHMYPADPGISDPALRRFIRRIGVEELAAQFALRHADITGSGLPKRDGANERFEERVWEEVARKPAFSIKDLAVGGDEVIAAMQRRGLAGTDFKGDERVGAALHVLFEQVTDVPERNERNSLLRLLEEYLESVS